MDEASVGSGHRVQVRLWDLVVAVVGSAYVLDVARQSRVAWGGGMPNQAQVLALVVLTLGVGVALIVMGRWARQVRERGREGRAWAATWRIFAMGGVLWSVAQVASDLRADGADFALAPVDRQRAAMSLDVDPLVAMLGLIGLILIASPIRRPRSGVVRRGWKSWPLVLVLTVASLFLVAEGHGIIPYLVLIAIEAVQNAMRNAPLVPRPILFDRLDVAGLESLPGLVGCFLTAVWLDDDLRGATGDPVAARRPRSWFGVLARAATVILAAVGSASVVFVSIPKLSLPVAEGLATIVDPSTAVTIVIGFSALAAGIAARSAARLTAGLEPPDPPRSPGNRPDPWPGRIVRTFVGLTSVLLVVAAIHELRKDFEDRWFNPIPFKVWAQVVHTSAGWLGYPAVSNRLEYLLYEPGAILIAVATAWLAYRMIVLFLARDPARSAPLDAIATDRLALGRFLGWWLGLATMMLASLPILAVAGVALTHYVVLWTTK
jgi:hypothetical protein